LEAKLANPELRQHPNRSFKAIKELFEVQIAGKVHDLSIELAEMAIGDAQFSFVPR
jgi:hypothetical protein